MTAINLFLAALALITVGSPLTDFLAEEAGGAPDGSAKRRRCTIAFHVVLWPTGAAFWLATVMGILYLGAH